MLRSLESDSIATLPITGEIVIPPILTFLFYIYFSTADNVVQTSCPIQKAITVTADPIVPPTYVTPHEGPIAGTCESLSLLGGRVSFGAPKPVKFTVSNEDIKNTCPYLQSLKNLNHFCSPFFPTFS